MSVDPNETAREIRDLYEQDMKLEARDELDTDCLIAAIKISPLTGDGIGPSAARMLVKRIERAKAERDAALAARDTWKAVALDRQSIKADYARLEVERDAALARVAKLKTKLQNLLDTFEDFFDLPDHSPTLQETFDAKLAMFSAAIQACLALEADGKTP